MDNQTNEKTKRMAFTVSWIKNSSKGFEETDKRACMTANVKLEIHFIWIL